jgi:hypothetical protein
VLLDPHKALDIDVRRIHMRWSTTCDFLIVSTHLCAARLGLELCEETLGARASGCTTGEGERCRKSDGARCFGITVLPSAPEWRRSVVAVRCALRRPLERAMDACP